jgi:heterodisulfide reductase subunit A-like polyferredoxin
MLKNIIIAAENFCIHQIKKEYSINDSLPKTKLFISYIDIEATDSKKYRIYKYNFYRT